MTTPDVPSPDSVKTGAAKKDPGNKAVDPTEARRRLEARADFVRARLIRGIDTLRNRTRRALDPMEEARRHPEALLAVAGGVVLLLGAGGTYLGYRASQKRKAGRRVRALLDAVTRRPAPPPEHHLALTLFERGATAALSSLIATVGKHWLESLLTGSPKPAVVWSLPPARDPFPSRPSPRTP